MNWRAFTLIELLVVLAVVAILIVILLPSLGRAREKARQTEYQAAVRSMGIAPVQHYGQNSFPTVGGILAAAGWESDWIGWQRMHWATVSSWRAVTRTRRNTPIRSRSISRV